MKRFFLSFFVILILFSSSIPARGIVGRHDRDDARYLKLGEKFPAVGRVLPDGVCTLISRRWVITAAHVAAPWTKPGTEGAVMFGDRKYAIKRVILHPDAKLEPGVPPEVDLALIELYEDVKGIKPLSIYIDHEEAGEVFTLVGFGDLGDGRSKPRRSDGKRRAATNKVSDLGPKRLFFKFDEPPEGTDLEGVSGPGDSGGPAMIEVQGRWLVAGISSGSKDGLPGRYGITDVYMRLSNYVEWIRKSMVTEKKKNP
jgi:hypothetical protein